ncbi:MAG: NUDIX hydrolase [Gammaproteobacteria bacterium]|nr:NUDIX hydrolase [Gammaproteobacteria bacterium]
MTAAHHSNGTPSASVILARDGDENDGASLEVLMVRRHQDTSFGSADAFPGGTVCAEDGRVGEFCGGLDRDQANRYLGTPSSGLDFYSAAIRELFEETGVLLAHGDSLPDRLLDDQRVALAQGELSWPLFLAEHELTLDAGALHYVSHWEAPLDFRPRFSTRFFVADMPGDQQVRHDGRELVGSRWVSPSCALQLGRAGELNLPFPTMKNLEALAGFRNRRELMQWARSRWQNGVRKMCGAVIEVNGKRRIVLPGEPGYPEDEI